MAKINRRKYSKYKEDSIIGLMCSRTWIGSKMLKSVCRQIMFWLYQPHIKAGLKIKRFEKRVVTVSIFTVH